MTLEKVSLPIIHIHVEVRCDHEFIFGVYAFDMPVAMALPTHSEVLKVLPPESFFATTIWLTALTSREPKLPPPMRK